MIIYQFYNILYGIMKIKFNGISIIVQIQDLKVYLNSFSRI